MLERQLCTEICMSRDDAQLARYQAAFARDWTALWRRVFRCHRHHRPGTRRDRRPDGAAARGIVGHPAEMLKALPGYGPDIAQRRVKARQIMETLGYGSDKRLAVTIAARNVPPWRDPTLILIDQLKEIYIDGELEPVDTTQWYPPADAQGFQSRAQRHRKRGRRSRCTILRKLQMRRAAQLHRILEQVGRRADRPAVAGNERQQAAAASLANREAADRRGCAPGYLIRARHHLSAALRQGSGQHSQQHLRWLALRGRLARPIARCDDRREI